MLTIRSEGKFYCFAGLTERDLELLLYLFEKVGGNSKGPRGRVDRFMDAFRVRNVISNPTWVEVSDLEGSHNAIFLREQLFVACSKCKTKVPVNPSYDPETGL